MDTTAPPDMTLIRLARQAARISAATAATSAGMSKSRWVQVEAGKEKRQGVERPAHARPATVARMARAVGIGPERLETEGQNPEAAMILREMRPGSPHGVLQPERDGITMKVPPGQVVTITLPGLTAIRVDTIRRVVAVDGTSGSATREEPLHPEWLLRDLRDGIYGDFHRLKSAGECSDADCSASGQHAATGTEE